MLIGIIGSYSSGIAAVASILNSKFGFNLIFIDTEFSKENIDTLLNDISLEKHDKQNFTCFATKEETLNFVTVNYQSDFIIIHNTSDLNNEIETLSIRPFYCSLGVTSSLQYSIKLLSQDTMNILVGLSSSMSLNIGSINILEQLENESISFDCYYKHANHIITLDSSDYMNNASVTKKIEYALDKLRMYIRPNWDCYFMEIAKLTSQRSNCMKRRVGAVLASRQFHRLISAGYNGTPTGLLNCFEGGCKRCNGNVGSGIALSTCFCLHAEENAIIEAGRDRISLYGKSYDHDNDRKGVILYTTCCPCITCAKKIVQAGISEVVYLDSFHTDDVVKLFLNEASIPLRKLI